MKELKEKELFEINGGNCAYNINNCKDPIIPSPVPPKPIYIGGGNWVVFD